MANKSPFGALLRTLRKARKLTHRELAATSGLSARAISNLERGENQRPRVDTIQMLTRGLQLAEAEYEQFVAIARGQSWIAVEPMDTPHNLPRDLPSFIGREREIVQVRALIARHRLVTLTGIGGCGKTRLALAAAEGLLAAFPDGVYFIDLTPVGDPATVIATILTRLEVPEYGQRSPEERLSTFLSQKTLLLIMDNFEHLIPAAPILSGLLARNATLKILATSRRELRLPDEVPFLVPPLDLPGRNQHPLPQVMAGYEAIQLFATRAQFARQGAALPPETLPIVLKICRILDGLPLAIELAAVRCAVLSPQEILDRLRDHQDLLTQGRRGPTRHQTLQAALGWSYELLAPDEQILFRRLAVFVGGCTLQMAEAICASGTESGNATLDRLQELVQHHLVRTGSSGDGETRYSMLETVRKYALDQLRAVNEFDEMSRRHLAWCNALAEQAEPHLDGGPAQDYWRNRLGAEYNNIRSTLAWSSTRDHEAGLRLAGSLWSFWFGRHYRHEGYNWLVLFSSRAQSVSTVQARACYGAGFLQIYQDIHVARRWFERAISLSRSARDVTLTARIILPLIHVTAAAGETGAARELLAEAEVLAGQFDDNFLGAVLMLRGNLSERIGELPTAQAALERALTVITVAERPHLSCMILAILGRTRLASGQVATAAEAFEQVASLAEGHDLSFYQALARCYLGIVAEWCGDESGALGYYDETLLLTTEREPSVERTLTLAGIGRLALRRGELTRATILLEDAARQAMAIHDAHLTGSVLSSLWAALWQHGERNEGIARFSELRALWTKVGNRLGLATMLNTVAVLAASVAQFARAVPWFAAAEAMQQVVGATRALVDRPRYDAILAAARAALGDKTFGDIWATGATLSLDVAIDAAESWLTTHADVTPTSPC